MNRSTFFDAVRPMFKQGLAQPQVDGTERILDEAQARGTPLRHLAYILATAFHETAHSMQPVREMGGEKYLRAKKYYPWVGEGLVQVTWEENHRKFGATAPGQMMTWPIALKAIFDGMTKGMFTGKKMSDYLNGEHPDYLNARKIVNGMDRAADIAAYAGTFANALREAAYIGQAPAKPLTIPPTTPVPSAPAPEPAERAPEPSVGSPVPKSMGRVSETTAAPSGAAFEPVISGKTGMDALYDGLERAGNPVKPKPATTEYRDPNPFWRALLAILSFIFGRK